MVSEHDIQKTLRASRVVGLDVPDPHGPLGLEHLAQAVSRIAGHKAEVLAIPVRSETREKLEQIARTETEAKSHPVTVADVAAAIIEQFVATAPTL